MLSEDTIVNITDVIIPEGVKSIESGTFYRCSNLVSVSLPSSVTTIGQTAFLSCGKLTTVNFSSNLESIGYSAFQYCKSLESIELPESVSDIESTAFAFCESLSKAILPSSLKTIGQGAFDYCKQLLTLTCKSATPPSLGKSVWGFIKVENGTLYVPKESLDLYKSTEQWKDWGAINEIDEETSINSIITNSNDSYSYKVIKDGKVIIVKNGVTYDLNGMKF